TLPRSYRSAKSVNTTSISSRVCRIVWSIRRTPSNLPFSKWKALQRSHDDGSSHRSAGPSQHHRRTQYSKLPAGTGKEQRPVSGIGSRATAHQRRLPRGPVNVVDAWMAVMGTPKAMTAAAHKLARIVYYMVTTRHEYDATVFQEQERRTQDR